MMPRPAMGPDDLIEVLIPVYNGAAWLAESLASIQRQTHTALCIHVVDDGSTDATPDILATAAARDRRIHVHRQPNGGIVAALNHGLGFCTAKWVARHDADDLAAPTRLQRQLAYLTAHPDCVAVGATARHIDAKGTARGTTTVLRPPEQADATWLPAREPYLMHPFMMARRQALQAVGGYRNVLHAEDSDLYWRLRDLGRLHNLPEVLGDYRLHDNSISSASLHNGRLMAVSSQLSALSARRRQAGQADLVFDTSHAQRLRQARTLHDMVEQAGAELTGDERRHLTMAVAAKLLELASYLPYEPDADDCRLIAKALQHVVFGNSSGVCRANQRALAGQLTRSAVRLCQASRPRDALRLLPARLWPAFALRYAVHCGVPARWRARLHAWRLQRMPAAEAGPSTGAK